MKILIFNTLYYPNQIGGIEKLVYLFAGSYDFLITKVIIIIKQSNLNII